MHRLAHFLHQRADFLFRSLDQLKRRTDSEYYLGVMLARLVAVKTESDDNRNRQIFFFDYVL